MTLADFLFLLAAMPLLFMGYGIIASNVPFWIDRLVVYWIARHATTRNGGLTFFRLPDSIGGSTFMPRR